jgi:hypothetical protein
MNAKQRKLERLAQYKMNSAKYDKAVVVTYGGLLALIDYIEECNEVFPELITNRLKNEVNMALNKVYETGADANVIEEHNEIANLFRELVNNRIK